MYGFYPPFNYEYRVGTMLDFSFSENELFADSGMPSTSAHNSLQCGLDSSSCFIFRLIDRIIEKRSLWAILLTLVL